MRALLFILFTASLLTHAVGCSGGSENAGMFTKISTGAAVNQAPAEQAGARGEQDKELPRKIIYTAQIELVVEGLDQAAQDLTNLLKDQGGYVARSEVQGAPGARRTGTWTVRVPAKNFDVFRDAVARLGELRLSKTDSDDITDRYFDLKARIKNKQREEERLLEHLKQSTGSLKDILAVEENLSRVRGEIEQMQGQMQRWDKETELATVTVLLHDRKNYVPPSSPDFDSRIGRTFSSSLSALVEFGKGTVLVAVALAPWLPLVALVVVPTWLFVRRRARRVRTPATPSSEPQQR